MPSPLNALHDALFDWVANDQTPLNWDLEYEADNCYMDSIALEDPNYNVILISHRSDKPLMGVQLYRYNEAESNDEDGPMRITLGFLAFDGHLVPFNQGHLFLDTTWVHTTPAQQLEVITTCGLAHLNGHAGTMEKCHACSYQLACLATSGLPAVCYG